ncbi:MAG TPA: hypothetical protein VK943_12395 [Arenibaculum sp.]|nr:hypothetical protein [Arenibaculum sp.]
MSALFAGLRPLLVPVAALLMLSPMLAACGEEETSGTAPAETSDLGRETDEALDAAGEAAGEIGEAAGMAVERAAEDLGRAGDAVGDAVGRALDDEPGTGAPAVTPEPE